MSLVKDDTLGGLPVESLPLIDKLGSWQLETDVSNIAEKLRHKVTDADGKSPWRLIADIIEDIFMVCQYTAI
jgi:hypothetical protein